MSQCIISFAEKEDVPEKPSLKDRTENKEEEEEEEKEGSVVDAFPDTPSATKDEAPSR